MMTLKEFIDSHDGEEIVKVQWIGDIFSIETKRPENKWLVKQAY